MRMILLAMAILAGLSLPARADEPAIRQVISSQIEAFRADDFETAFTYASPSIKSIFGTPERFGVMVRKGYPMVWRPAEVQFLSIEEIAGQLWQNVAIRDATGALHVLEYQMISGDNGWKINAVRIKKAPQGAV